LVLFFKKELLSCACLPFPAIVQSDATVRRGVVSMSHGFGGMPGESVYERDGSSTGALISTDRDLDPINAMPRMSAIPVRISVGL